MLRGMITELQAAAGTDETIARVLDLARQRLGMELAWVSHFTGDEQVVEAVSGALPGVEVAAGFAGSLTGSYCIRVNSGELPPVINDAAANPVTAALDVTHQLGIGAYVSAPLRTSTGQLYGHLCCFSHNTNPDLSQRDADVLGMLADLIADSIDAKARAHQARAEVRDHITAVIDAGGPRMVFQAVYAVPEMQVVGYEALARFPATYTGPEKWFSRAAEVGLGVDLELVAMDRALDVLTVLPDSLRLAVNLSPAAICHPSVIQRVEHRFPQRLIIEITEHQQVTDFQHLRDRMAVLRGLGVRFAADDAGSGYAGMRQLVEMRPDIIKMDYHLTHDIDTDPARLAMATALALFAAATGATLLAEGVETPGELDAVTGLGISRAQGYHLSMPVELDTIELLAPLLNQPEQHTTTRHRVPRASAGVASSE